MEPYMNFIECLSTPGEHALIVPGPIGSLEVHVSVPVKSHPFFVAVLGHPHSLQGGTMNNKVVTTMARMFKELGIPSLRFNFRGVGQSQGVYDNGVGESEDMIALATCLQHEKPAIKLIFSGFSFGSYVAYRAASYFPQSVLVTIAPAVHHYDYLAYTPKVGAWLLVQGEQDEIVPIDLVRDFVRLAQQNITYIEMAETSHFFHGKLIELKNHLLNFFHTRVLST